MTLTTDEARELYAYITTNPQPMRELESVYRMFERGIDPQPSRDTAMEICVNHAASSYTRTYATGSSYAIFSELCRIEVGKRLVSDFETELAAGNSWIGVRA